MKTVVLAAAVIVFATGFANAEDAPAVRAAMSAIGPAYMCGAPYEFGERLEDLKVELMKIGVPSTLAGYAADGVKDYVVENHKDKREEISAKECEEKYKRPN